MTTTRSRARMIVRRTIDTLAVLTVAAALASIEQLPAWLPFLLILTAGALAWLARRLTVTARRADHTALIRFAKETHHGHR